MYTISIDSDSCSRCGSCVRVCPESVFAQAGGDDMPEAVHAELCISCGHCAAMCPTDALQHEAFPEESLRQINRALLPSYEQTLELLRSRRSVRLFTDTLVSREDVKRVLDAATCAPTAHNLQEVRYVVVQEGALLKEIVRTTVVYFSALARQLRNPLIRALFRLALTRPEIDSAIQMLPTFDHVQSAFDAGRDPILRNAPCILIAHSKKSVNYPEANAAMALHNATLAAHAMGLGTFHLGFVVGACKRSRRIPRLLGIPDDHDVYAGIALGHPALSFPKWMTRKPVEPVWK